METYEVDRYVSPRARVARVGASCRSTFERRSPHEWTCARPDAGNGRRAR